MWEAPTPDRALEEEELSHEKVLHKTLCTYEHIWHNAICTLHKHIVHSFTLNTLHWLMINNTKSGSPNHFSTPVVTLVGPKKCSENFHVKEVLLKICTLQFKLRQNNYTRKSNKVLKVRAGGYQRPNVSRPQFVRSFYFIFEAVRIKSKCLMVPNIKSSQSSE